jgi:hypothetical protein
MSAWKRLETNLHALAEGFTQGLYGNDGDKKVQLGALMEDFNEYIDQYAIDSTFEKNDDEE